MTREELKRLSEDMNSFDRFMFVNGMQIIIAIPVIVVLVACWVF